MEITGFPPPHPTGRGIGVASNVRPSVRPSVRPARVRLCTFRFRSISRKPVDGFLLFRTHTLSLGRVDVGGFESPPS